MRLRFTRLALAELKSILDYLADQSPRSARGVQARIQAMLSLLRTHPNIGIRTDDPTIRRLVTAPYPYLIFYEIGPDEIVIHAVRHGARDPEGSKRSE